MQVILQNRQIDSASAKVLAARAEEVLDDEVIPHSTISFADTGANSAGRYSPSFPGQVQESRILVTVPSNSSFAVLSLQPKKATSRMSLRRAGTGRPNPFNRQKRELYSGCAAVSATTNNANYAFSRIAQEAQKAIPHPASFLFC
jgi:hypothetical protein